jgi:uncharacterized OB-fold protein
VRQGESSELPPRAVPVTVHRSASSAEFFDAAARSRLLIRRCLRCANVRAARRFLCRHCGSADAEWCEASGRAELVSWGANPANYPTPRMLFGLLDLAEGPWVESLLIDARPRHLYPGAPFVVTFVRGPEGDAFPAFTPAAGARARAGQTRATPGPDDRPPGP